MQSVRWIPQIGAWLLLAVLLLLVMPMHPAASAQSANLVTNPGFESGQVTPWTSWTNQPGGNGTVVTGNAHSGNYSGRVQVQGGFEQVVAVRPNTTYTLSGWLATTGGAIRLGVKNPGFAEDYREMRSARYAQVSLSFTTGAATTKVTIFVFKPYGGGDSYGDDVVLTSGASVPETPQPTTPPNPTAPPNPTPSPPTAVIPSSTPAPGSGNLVKNAGFESGSLTKWRIGGTGNGGATFATAEAHSGTASVAITGEGDVSQVVTGLRGQTRYVLSAWVKAASQRPIWAGVKEYGGSETYRTSSAAGWTQLSVAFVTGPVNTSAKVFLYVPDHDAIAYGDDIRVVVADTPAPPAPPITPTVITPGNLLANPDFEVGNDEPWHDYESNGAFGDIVAWHGHSGAYAVAMAGIKEAGYYQIVAVTPNTRYTLSGWLRVAEGVDSVILGVEGTGMAKQTIRGGAASYTRRAIVFTTGATTRQVTVFVERIAGAEGVTYADDLALVPGGELPPSPPEPTLPAPPAAPSTLDQGSLFEAGFTAVTPIDPERAYTQLQVTVTFTAPNGATTTVPAFWHSGQSWWVRFMPSVAGAWRYQVTNNRGDAGLTRSGSFTVRPASARGFIRRDPQFPQSFRYDNGEHFFMLGQTAYEVVMTARAGMDWKTAIDQARAHGMTKLRLLIHPWGGNGSAPDSFPFPANDHNQLDPLHWATLDRIVQYLAQQRMAADLILFTDTGDTASVFGTLSQDERYVRYILARYAAYPNVIWCLSNEWNYTGKSAGYWNPIGGILRDEDPYSRAADGAERARSIHQGTGNTFNFFGQSWPSYAIVQDGARTKEGFRFGDQWGNDSIMQNAGNGMPVANDEYGYLGDTIKATGQTMTQADHRNALWGIALGGGYATAGDKRLLDDGASPMLSGQWRDAPEYDDILRFARFWAERGIPYWQMTSQNQIVRQGTRVYALGTPGSQYVVYAAAGGTLTLALPAGTSYRVTRYNPRDGTSAGIGTVSGTATITLPDNQDWVFVLQEL